MKAKKNKKPSKSMVSGKWVGATLLGGALLLPSFAHASGWVTLANQMQVGTMLLLSDGSVMAEAAGTSSTWYRLTNDFTGGYTNSEWTQIQSMHYTRLYCASQVLPNGNVFVAGGEYGTGKANAEVYNPVANSWANAPATPSTVGFVDACSEMMQNGNVLISPVNPNYYGQTLVWITATSSWSNGPTLYQYSDSSEAAWVKLPDNSVLTVDALGNSSGSGYNAQRYIPAINQWIPDANVTVQLFANLLPYYVGETGGACLLPNGKAFFVGGAAATALYTPSGGTNEGSWSAGPSIPNSLVAADAPMAMMPNGQVLAMVSPAPYFTQVTNLNFGAPSSFYIYNYASGANGSWSQINSPTGGTTDNTVSYNSRMLVLPDGTVLFTDGGGVYDYVPGGGQVAAGQPSIYSISYNGDGSLLLSGTLFNGISEGASYGDDAQMNSNYPLVRFTSGGNVYYGRTHDWSSTGVSTGSTIIYTSCTLPANLPTGPCTIQVVANGIASPAYSFSGPVWVNFNYTGGAQNGTYQYPYKTMAQGISAVPSGGTILLNGAQQPSYSSETPSITKAMSIYAVNGPSTIGN